MPGRSRQRSVTSRASTLSSGGGQAVISVAVDERTSGARSRTTGRANRVAPATDDRPFPYFRGGAFPSLYLFALAGILLVSCLRPSARRPVRIHAAVRRSLLHGSCLSPPRDEEHDDFRAAVRDDVDRECDRVRWSTHCRSARGRDDTSCPNTTAPGALPRDRGQPRTRVRRPERIAARHWRSCRVSSLRSRLLSHPSSSPTWRSRNASPEPKTRRAHLASTFSVRWLAAASSISL